MKREHVLLLDRWGYDAYRHPDGRPYLDPDRYDVTLVTSPDKAHEHRPGEVSRLVTADTSDSARVLNALPEIQAGPPVDRIAAVTERLLVPAAAFREALAVPGLDVARTTLFRHKVLMKRHVDADGVRTPEFTEITAPADAAPLLEKHGTIILKPVDSWAAQGVHKVTDRAGLRLLERTGLGHPGPYQAEEFIEGTPCHIDSVVQSGRPVAAMASHYLDLLPALAPGDQRRSVAIDAGPAQEALLAFNRHVLATMPWFSGVTHLEVFLQPDGTPVFCEIAARPGGAGVIPSFRHRHGVDLRLAALLGQLGLPLPRPRQHQPAHRRATGWLVSYPADPGRCRTPGQRPDADWLVRLTWLTDPSRTPPATVTARGLAAATVCGPDQEAVTRRLAQVKSWLTGDTPADPGPTAPAPVRPDTTAATATAVHVRPGPTAPAPAREDRPV
ncbi:acetyl-CoA carboxylase biotin carboxylase subunit family protein [Streptomyces sp. NPDC059371]|uniref:ATP-grasp domain-containing protein n=1 Tax=Streptomyces sp. NPDC059371 TaxID=3346812 RepID=UPI00368410A8